MQHLLINNSPRKHIVIATPILASIMLFAFTWLSQTHGTVNLTKSILSNYFTLGHYDAISAVQRAFIHANIIHLVLNVVAFVILGSIIERITGPIIFTLLVLSFATTCGLSIAFVPSGISVGASGIVYALSFCYAYFYGKLPFLTAFCVLELVALYLTKNQLHIDWVAHIIGAGIGLLWGWYWVNILVKDASNEDIY